MLYVAGNNRLFRHIRQEKFTNFDICNHVSTKITQFLYKHYTTLTVTNGRC